MKEFDLEAAKAGKKVMTREGKEARIICFDRKDPVTPIVALISEKGFSNSSRIEEQVAFYGPNGRCSNTEYNLVMATQRKVGWVNIYTEPGGDRSVIGVYPNKQEAEKDALKDDEKAIATVRIEWEE